MKYKYNTNKDYNANAWLLTWNPKRWNWEDYDDAVKITRIGMGYCTGWNCANSHAEIGDRVFMAKLGGSSTPKGIFATGYVVSGYEEDDNYDDNKIIVHSIEPYRTMDGKDMAKYYFADERNNTRSVVLIDKKGKYNIGDTVKFTK